jgi:hypothetical protein
MSGFRIPQTIPEFLKFLQPDSRFLLAAIHAHTGEIVAESFSDYEQAEAWALGLNEQGNNLYYTVNLVSKGLSRKPAKSDIQATRAFWADIDPNIKRHGSYLAARESLMNGVLAELRAAKASIVVDSGNGLQPLFVMPHPTGLNGHMEEYEQLNAKVGKKFHGPATYSCDHLLRLPFTKNYPTKTKLAKGYLDNPSWARVIDCSGIRYTEEKIAKLCRSRVEEFLESHPKAKARWEGSAEGLTDTSGSGMDLSMVAMLKAGGLPEEEVKEALHDWPHGSKAARNRKSWDRAFDRCWVKAIESDSSGIAQSASGKKVLPPKATHAYEVINERWVEQLRFNEFLLRPELAGEPLTDKQVRKIHLWLEKTTGRSFAENLVSKAIDAVCDDKPYDPLVAYLDSLVWDKTPRIERWLSDVYGIDHDEYTAAIGQCWVIGAVARAYVPGVKIRNVLTLQGPEDIGKSLSLADLCPDPNWFSDSLPADLHTKEAAESVLGKWIIESAEMASMRKSAQEAIKAFLSRNSDYYRPSYGRKPEDIKRRCVFAATTNSEAVLAFGEENTRFWPIRVKEYNRDFLLNNRDQLWAESVSLYKAGNSWWLKNPEIKKLAAKVREDFQQDDPITEKILALGLGNRVTTAEVIGLFGLNINDAGIAMKVGTALRGLGYKRKQGQGGNRYYIKDSQILGG